MRLQYMDDSHGVPTQDADVEGLRRVNPNL